MIPHKDGLRLHVINMGHGDAILVELPDRGGRMRFGLVDAGKDTDFGRLTFKARDYIDAFVEWRMEREPPVGDFEFLCLTHPHEDHYSGILPVLHWARDKGMHPRQFWDSGFRCTLAGYLNLIKYLIENNDIRFLRVTSGTEFHYGPVEVLVMAPSVDLRNRFDTQGVEANDASIVLRLRRGASSAILAGDAEYFSWAKVVEEFPNKYHLTYPTPTGDAGEVYKDIMGSKNPNLVFKSRTTQLNCDLLKVAHHGSKNGTSFECLEKLKPTHYAITCDDPGTYSGKWIGGFPHPLTRIAILDVKKLYNPTAPAVPDLGACPEVGTTYAQGSMIYTIGGTQRVVRTDLGDGMDGPITPDMFAAALGQA